MTFTRGYDRWAQGGAHGWGWSEALLWFKRIESREGRETAVRGGSVFNGSEHFCPAISVTTYEYIEEVIAFDQPSGALRRRQAEQHGRKSGIIEGILESVQSQAITTHEHV
jgi:hypothetical protein